MRMRWTRVLASVALLATLRAPAALAAAQAERTDAAARLDQAGGLLDAGRFAAAESLATLVRDDLERQAHPDTVMLARAWFDIASSRQRRYLLADSTGRVAARRSLQLLQARGAGPDTLELAAMREIGWFLSNTRRAREALGQFRPALAIARSHPEWGPVPPSSVLYDIGQCLQNLGQGDSALVVLEQALEIRRHAEVPRDPLPGDVLALEATIFEQQGRDERAERAFAEAIREDEDRLGPKHPKLAGPLSRAAAFAFRRGDYAGAYDDYAQCVTALSGSPGNPNVLLMRGGMAQALDQMGDVARAHEIFEEVMPGMEARLGAGTPAVLNGWLSLASACTKLGETARAHELYAKVRAAYAGDTTGSERLSLAAALNSEALLYGNEGVADSVLSLGRQAEEILRAGGEPEPTLTAQALTYQLRVHGARGEWAAADSVDARLARVLDHAMLQGNNMTDDAWVTRSDLAERRGRHAEAVSDAATGARGARERLLRNVRALSDRQSLTLAGALSVPLDQLLLVGALGDPASARLCWDEVARTRGLVRAEMSRRRLPPAVAGDSALAGEHAAWVRAEQRLARLEVDVAGSQHDAETDSALAARRADVDEAERRLVMASSAYVLPADPARVTLDSILTRLAPRQALVGFVQVPREDGSRHLAAFVAHGGADAGTAAGSPAVTSVDLGDLAGLGDAIAAWRGQLGEIDPRRRSEAACRIAGARVRAQVWDPIAAAAAGARDVFLVPESPVAGLPWGALPDGPHGYLVEREISVHVLDAERELLPSSPAAAGHGLLAIGGVDYDREAMPAGVGPLVAGVVRAPLSDCDRDALAHLAPLPGTGEEAREVAAAWNGSAAGADRAICLEGGEATESAFKRLAASQQVIHLATHGIALSDSCGPGPAPGGGATAGTTRSGGGAPVRGVGGLAPVGADAHAGRAPARTRHGAASTAATPAATAPRPPSPWMGRQVLLALADANHALEHPRDADDGLLTAEEVTTLDLRGVDWVVLSACHSGAGLAWAREGVLGMQRAFHLAGARTVIASQWSVDDDATRDWMRALYGARADGARSAADAMASASRTVLDARRRARRSTHPFYWAAFTATGE